MEEVSFTVYIRSKKRGYLIVPYESKWVTIYRGKGTHIECDKEIDILSHVKKVELSFSLPKVKEIVILSIEQIIS